MKAGSSGHLDDSSAAIVDQGPAGGDGLAEGAVDAGESVATAEADDDGVDGAGSAVGEREAVNVGMGEDALNTDADGADGFESGEAALELLGSEEDAHVVGLYLRVRDGRRETS